MRIANKGKFLRGIIVLLIIILLILFCTSKQALSYNVKKIKSLYVCLGDTLWSIASDLQQTEYYKDKDIRFIINEIKEINNLKSCDIFVGQELKFFTI